MAFTERYVSVAGGGAHDGTTEADAWTFAEMITALGGTGTGIRVNMKAGTYSEGATTVPTGTVAAPYVIRGYNSTIGDLDNLGRNADGTLNTTNMPDLTITATWTPGPWSCLQNLDITGAISGYLIGSTAIDFWGTLSCRIINTQNNAAAGCCQYDNDCFAINTDMDCTGAAHGVVADADVRYTAIACRFHTTSTSTAVVMQTGSALHNLVYGNSSGIAFDTGTTDVPVLFYGNTVYGMGTALRTPNSVNVGWFFHLNNHITDTTTGRDSQYSGTANVAAIFANNRTRDVTTPATGFEDVAIGSVTTDGGGAETDYTDAGAGNFRLISTAPGKATGMTPYMDIGAYQREEAASGGGAPYHGAMAGGMLH